MKKTGNVLFSCRIQAKTKCNQESRFKTRERLNFQFSQVLTIKQQRERRKLHFDGIVLSGFFFSLLLLLMQVQSKKVKPSWFCFCLWFVFCRWVKKTGGEKTERRKEIYLKRGTTLMMRGGKTIQILNVEQDNEGRIIKERRVMYRKRL